MAKHGDIDHTGITGVGGSVATDAIWDAAGDLAVGSGANTAAKLTKGSNGDVLTVTAGTVGWAAPAGGGGSAFKGARVYHSTTQSITASTFTAVLFDTEEYDTTTYHSTASNTSRMTIPAGDSTGHYYRITSRVYVAGNGVAPICIFRKNGTDVPGSVSAMRSSDTVAIVNTVTLQMDATDYVECFFIHFAGGALNIGDATNDENRNSMEIHYLG